MFSIKMVQSVPLKVFLHTFCLLFESKSTCVFFFSSGVKMYRTTRSPMMQPLVNSGMGMAPFFKVNAHQLTDMIRS